MILITMGKSDQNAEHRIVFKNERKMTDSPCRKRNEKLSICSLSGLVRSPACDHSLSDHVKVYGLLTKDIYIQELRSG